MDKPFPTNVRHIHLIAICGTGMGALACMLNQMGYRVTGSDHNIYPPISDFLLSHGIHIFIGYSAKNLEQKPDLVVIGNAISKDNPEVLAMMSLSIPYCSMPEAINRFVAAGKKQIVVTGTHGKTTTASFISWLLYIAGFDPSFIIGGIVNGFNSNYRFGKGQWIVLEGDEYDTAFFDKGPKFLHYKPEVTVLTNIEFDHADIYRDLDHVKSAFSRLISGVSERSTIIAYDDDPNVSELITQAKVKALKYGRLKNSTYYLENVEIKNPFTHFEVCRLGERATAYKTRLIGEHNICNLLAGIAVGDYLNIMDEEISAAIESFKGAKRRQEVRGVKNAITIIDDFAHHPTAVQVTVRAIKAFYNSSRLIAVFEPRTNSSRRNIFQKDYAKAFDAADLICIRQAPNLEKIPTDQRFSSVQLVSDLIDRGHQASFFQNTDDIIDYLRKNCRAGDVILVMSNGGFDNIHSRLLEQL
jgi:UDP-N-acetylmuramate: L-alanyl-gamma-D-glutamyl-meso-diaminopimelate ligase